MTTDLAASSAGRGPAGAGSVPMRGLLVRGLLAAVGAERFEFACCDTTFAATVAGVRAGAAARRAMETAADLESQLNAFDEGSAVAALNREGSVENEHVARIVERWLEYSWRTAGRFDVRQGETEHRLKRYLRGEADGFQAAFGDGQVSVDGACVETDVPLDLNGLAKGYIVDQAAASLSGVARRGFVDGGGDLSPPTGPVAVESPYGDETPLRVLDTGWSVATSGSYRRRRSGADHIYDPARGRVGARSELVTVVAERDCMEADALATTLAASHPEEAIDLAEGWPGLEALVVTDGVFRETGGFGWHVA